MNDDFLSGRVGRLPLPKSLVLKLEKHGIDTIEGLTKRCERELFVIEGIGKKSVTDIKEALDSRGLQLAEDRYGSKLCARHNKGRGDTRIQTYFLCKDCADAFKKEALNDIEPVYMTTIEGGPFFCSHCNEDKQLMIYQWQVCEVCDRVLRSIGRGLRADRGVLDWWEEEKKRKPSLPEIEETDEPILLPVESNEEKSARTPKFDFIWKEDGNMLFGAEIKTGRNHLEGGSIKSKMTQFQLDVSDIEGVLAAMDGDDYIPAYLFHCQVVDVPAPPTAKYECVGIWWTSIKDLIENIKNIRKRPRETRLAAYIDTSTFKPIPTFIEEMESHGYKKCPKPAILSEALKKKV